MVRAIVVVSARVKVREQGVYVYVYTIYNFIYIACCVVYTLHGVSSIMLNMD